MKTEYIDQVKWRLFWQRLYSTHYRRLSTHASPYKVSFNSWCTRTRGIYTWDDML